MTGPELISKILKRIFKRKWVILFGSILLAVAGFLYAHSVPIIYTVSASVFPLNAAPEGNSTSSRLSELLGAGGGSKAVSEDAGVSIEEVAKSKKTRAAVVSEVMPAYGNKLLAEVLINTYNKSRGPFTTEVKMPLTDAGKITVATRLLEHNYSIKFNKNSLLEIIYSSGDPKLLIPVCNLLIDKVSNFYIDLKISKAKADYNFLRAKVDSFDAVLSGYDRQRIEISNKTLFVPDSRLQYSVPKENLDNSKLQVLEQRNVAAANREGALWRLQKITPIVQVLDKPQPPFDEEKPSAIIYAGVAFFIGLFLLTLIFTGDLLYQYAALPLRTAIDDQPADANTSTTA